MTRRSGIPVTPVDPVELRRRMVDALAAEECLTSWRVPFEPWIDVGSPDADRWQFTITPTGQRVHWIKAPNGHHNLWKAPTVDGYFGFQMCIPVGLDLTGWDEPETQPEAGDLGVRPEDASSPGTDPRPVRGPAG